MLFVAPTRMICSFHGGENSKQGLLVCGAM